jgi:hypothetical protein
MALNLLRNSCTNFAQHSRLCLWPLAVLGTVQGLTGLKFVSPFVSHHHNSPVKYGGERGIRTPDTAPHFKYAFLLAF